MYRTLFALLLIAPVVAVAIGDDVPADREILQVKVSPSSALVEVSPQFADSQGCAQSGSGWLEIDLATDKSLFTTVLAAATARQKVGFRLLGCAGGSLAYPLVKRVDVTY